MILTSTKSLALLLCKFDLISGGQHKPSGEYIKQVPQNDVTGEHFLHRQDLSLSKISVEDDNPNIVCDWPKIMEGVIYFGFIYGIKMEYGTVSDQTTNRVCQQETSCVSANQNVCNLF